MHFFQLCFLLGAVLLTSHIWVFLRVLRPIHQLSAQAAELTKGHFDALDRPCTGIPEIESLRRSMSSMVGHVRRAQEQSRAYAGMVSEGQEAERGRLARELHDETVQSLIAVAQSLDFARAMPHERVDGFLKEARQQIIDTVAALRDMIADLRPPALEELGLIPALEMQSAKYPDLNISVKSEGITRRLSETQELTLFRAAQEALSNACRHSHAKNIDITVTYSTQTAAVTIHDDGQGFNPHEQMAALATTGHYGLLGIQERVEHLNGTLNVRSHPGKGTTIEVTLPIGLPAQPENTVHDPVCHTLIQPQQAYGHVDYEGTRFYFCCPVCQGAFQRNPSLYLTPAPDVHTEV